MSQQENLGLNPLIWGAWSKFPGTVPRPSPQGSSWDAGEPLEQPGALFPAGMVAPGSRDHWKCSDCGKGKLRQLWIMGISRKKVGMRQESAPSSGSCWGEFRPWIWNFWEVLRKGLGKRERSIPRTFEGCVGITWKSPFSHCSSWNNGQESGITTISKGSGISARGFSLSHGSPHPHLDPTQSLPGFSSTSIFPPHLDPASTRKNGNCSTPIPWEQGVNPGSGERL